MDWHIGKGDLTAWQPGHDFHYLHVARILAKRIYEGFGESIWQTSILCYNEH